MKTIPNQFKSALLIFFLVVGSALAARPSDPWILRASMREKPRMVLMALSSDLSLAYDAQTCGLYLGWRGGMQDGNVTYNHQQHGNRGATFYPQKEIFYKQAPGGGVSGNPGSDNRPNGFSPPNEALITVWSGTAAGVAATVKADWQGYWLDKEQTIATLRYNIDINGKRVSITESPESTGAAGAPTLQRDFVVKGLPSGVVLSLMLTGNPITRTEGQKLTEQWTATGSAQVTTQDGKSFIAFDRDGQSRLTGTWR